MDGFCRSTIRFVLVPFRLFDTPRQLAVLVNCCELPLMLRPTMDTLLGDDVRPPLTASDATSTCVLACGTPARGTGWENQPPPRRITFWRTTVVVQLRSVSETASVSRNLAISVDRECTNHFGVGVPRRGRARRAAPLDADDGRPADQLCVAGRRRAQGRLEGVGFRVGAG